MDETNNYYNILLNCILTILIWIFTSTKYLINQRSFSYICKIIIIFRFIFRIYDELTCSLNFNVHIHRDNNTEFNL